MTPKRYLDRRKIPAGVVRDLLAITRVLYSARRAEGAGPDELERLELAGRAFKQALSMSHCEADTIGGRAAWSWSEKGLALLGEALSNGDVTVAKLVANWAGKLVQFPEK